jgi:hypothetical protein
MPSLRDRRALLAKYHLERAFFIILEKNASFELGIKVKVIEAYIGTVISKGRAVASEKPHVQRAIRSLFDTHLSELPRDSWRLSQSVEAHLSESGRRYQNDRDKSNAHC